MSMNMIYLLENELQTSASNSYRSPRQIKAWHICALLLLPLAMCLKRHTLKPALSFKEWPRGVRESSDAFLMVLCTHSRCKNTLLDICYNSREWHLVDILGRAEERWSQISSAWFASTQAENIYLIPLMSNLNKWLQIRTNALPPFTKRKYINQGREYNVYYVTRLWLAGLVSHRHEKVKMTALLRSRDLHRHGYSYKHHFFFCLKYLSLLRIQMYPRVKGTLLYDVWV